jgi:O-antigen ligase
VSSALAMQPEPAPATKAAQLKITSTAILTGAFVILLFGPLAFGAVEPWAVFALEASSMLLLGFWVYRQWESRQANVFDHVLYRPMATFFCLALLQWLIGTTAYRLETYTHLLLYAAYGMLVFVVSQTLRRPSHFELMAKLFTAYGGALAAFAILQGLAPNGKLYWIFPLQQGGFIYGPYVNHNHYAGLMEMLTPFPLVLAATSMTGGNRKIAIAAVAALMAASVFLSGSRAGMVAIIVQVLALGVLLLRKRDAGWQQPIMLGGFLALVIVFLVWMGGNEVTRRLVSIHSEAREEITGGVRLAIDRDCLRMFMKRPVLGWGLGTFPVVYPQFRSFYTTFFVNEAHNDYLQLLVETGLAGLGIAIWFLVLVFRQGASKLENWTETASGTLTVASLLGCVGILVHSWLDFNLQIPANAALFYVLCAIAALAPLQESQRRRVVRRQSLIVEPVASRHVNSDTADAGSNP